MNTPTLIGIDRSMAETALTFSSSQNVQPHHWEKRRSAMKAVLSACAILLMVLIGVPVYAVESLVLYDDFNVAHIDPNRWSWAAGWGGASTEAIRQLQDHRLRLVYRGYGKTDSDSEKLWTGHQLFFPNAAAITAIRATVQFTDVVATGCHGNPKSTETFAIFGGFFFNTATPTPGSWVNDVQAGIRMFRGSDATDPPDVLRVQSLVFRCADEQSCDTKLHFEDLGPVKRGEVARLRMQWDRDNHRFIFQRDDDAEVLAPYTVSDTAPPSNRTGAHKALSVIHAVANCTAAPRPVAFIEALFDDVMVNESAAPRLAR
jgi:hypothetical protein